MQILAFLFQSDVSTMLTATVASLGCLGLSQWAAHRDEKPKGKRRKR